MTLTIKASLHRWGQKEPLEIRRFFVEQDVSTSYSNLLKKVVEMFRCVDPDKLDITWTGRSAVYGLVYTSTLSAFPARVRTDKEGDRIVISSDTELAEATTQLDSNILRLTITGIHGGGGGGGRGGREGGGRGMRSASREIVHAYVKSHA